MSNISVVDRSMAELNLNNSTAKELPIGRKPLSQKLAKGDRKGPFVQLETNMSKIELKPNVSIFKYAVEVLMFFKKENGEEFSIELSKSRKRGFDHEHDKKTCVVVYEKACKKSKELNSGGNFVYDRQALLYSTTKLKTDPLSIIVDDKDVCSRSNFIRAELKISKVADSFQTTTNDVSKTVHNCPALADTTILEVLNLMASGEALKDSKVLTIGNCVHYLYDDAGIQTHPMFYDQGLKSSAVGASKSIKTLEGREKQPSLYMATELKTTLFHPDDTRLIDLLKSYPGFDSNKTANSFWATNVQHSLQDLFCFLDYGKNKNLNDDRITIQIARFGDSAVNQKFEYENRETGVSKPVSVFEYYKMKYGITLSYPNLFTIVAKGRGGKNSYFPVECLQLCNGQPVRTSQMIGTEQADLIKYSAALPAQRKEKTDKVVKALKLGTDEIGLMRVNKPETVTGRVLEKPKIKFGPGGRMVVNWEDPRQRGAATDFNITKFIDPKSLTNWDVVFDEGEPNPVAIENLMETMKMMGMQVAPPRQFFIQKSRLRPIFESAAAKKVQLLLFITKQRNNYHQEIKALEQEFDILTQDMKFETAVKLPRQQNTKKNIVNKINVKLGGLNYEIESPELQKRNSLIIGLETSQKGGLGDAPISIGFSANMMDHPQKFSGGFVFVYGPVLQKLIHQIIKQAQSRRTGELNQILIYISGITEGQYGIINEKYSMFIMEACRAIHPNAFRPEIIIVAVSKTHNTRLYKNHSGQLSNVDPGTVVDEVIVSPVLTEWYLTSAVARQGTAKPIKYSLIFAVLKNNPLTATQLQKMTYDLAFGHQIVYSPVSLPVPLYLAGECSTRGAALLATRRATFTNGEFDMTATNNKLGYIGKNLFNTRFNA
ncbi:hypothetical protein GCK72_017904 [Caenorhabditis remanei]|uniref:Uncharacterized protein n=1 Tax=Caenorhabditis remanei TaxID=31234 RepID=A0A6A5G8P8_CAERE|nr:hypothetical protein GCK72_017904 [Caenorhabditis remanei]KAF1751350.1 hypothetical protein GCK72_017904 [Caenorhabditis remanei]